MFSCRMCLDLYTVKMLFVYLSCLLLLLYALLRKNNNYWKSRGVPFEKPFLFFGSFYNVVRRKEHMSETLRTIYNSHKTPYVGIHIFTQPTLVIKSPELVKKVLVKDFDKFANRKVASNEAVDPFSFHNLFITKDATWKNLRPKISPAFTSGKMKLMYTLIQECAEDLNGYLSKHAGEVIDARNVTKKFTVDVISSCAFGVNAYCLQNEESEIMKMASRLLDLKSVSRNFSAFCFMFLPKFVDIFRLTLNDVEAANYLLNLFKETLRIREERNIVRNDLIDLLNNLRKNEKSDEVYKFDDFKMAAQAILFFGAGSDTTSSTLSFTLHELALNQDIQDKLRKEIREYFENTGSFTYENIQEMKYLDMVLCETLRKYPLTSFLTRESTADYTFEETGFKIEKNVSVMIPVSGLHFDPEYFPNSDIFDPERFRDKSSLTPYTYIPFGEGPRNCIRQRFGLMVAKTALAYIIKNFKFEPCSATSVHLKFDATAVLLESTNGVPLKLVKV